MKLTRNNCLPGALLLAALYFIYPIPHTAALRSLLLLLLIGLAAVLWKRGDLARTAGAAAWQRGEFVALGALTLWMAVQTSLGAVERTHSLSEFGREWLGGLFAAWLGYNVVRGLAKRYAACPGILAAGIVLALIAHAFWMLGYQAAQWLHTGRYLIGDTPYGDYSVLSTPINMAFALLVADLAVRWAGDGALFPWSRRATQWLLIAAAVAVVAVKARNGVITVFVVLLVVALLFAWRSRRRWQSRRTGAAVLLALALATGLLVANFRSDTRWTTFAETVPIALDTETHKRWLDDTRYPLPTLASGQPVEESAYLRIAWAKVALEGIASRPLGYGYGLGGFGRYVEAKYGMMNFVSSHSGLLDFTLANGVPGLALLLAFCALLFRRGWLCWKGGNPWGLALALTLTNYFVRIVLDGHFGSFRLNMVMLLCGFLYWPALQPRQAADE